jgi:ankyrin
MRLLAAGADVNATSVSGDTPLLLACHWGNQDVALALIKRGADVNARDAQDLATPLQIARREKLVRVVHALREAGARL